MQRTDTNRIMDAGGLLYFEGTWWLHGTYSTSHEPIDGTPDPGDYDIEFSERGWIRPFSENVDLKENYVPHFYNVFALYCPGATNYPIKIQVCLKDDEALLYGGHPLYYAIADLHYYADGSLVDRFFGYANISCNNNFGEPFLITGINQIALIQFCDISTVFDSTNIEDILYPNPANDLIVLKMKNIVLLITLECLLEQVF